MPRPSTGAFAEGQGTTLGAAILACFDDVPRIQPARSPRSRVIELTATRRGSAALEAAGLNVSRSTLLRWLADEQSPSPSNAHIIDRAYRDYLRYPTAPIVRRVSGAIGVITGLIKISDDIGLRTIRVDNRAGDWRPIVREWRRPNPNPDEIELLYIIGVVIPDVRDIIEFPGTNYLYQLE
jgi:hypothetical protein